MGCHCLLRHFGYLPFIDGDTRHGDTARLDQYRKNLVVTGQPIVENPKLCNLLVGWIQLGSEFSLTSICFLKSKQYKYTVSKVRVEKDNEKHQSSFPRLGPPSFLLKRTQSLTVLAALVI